MTIVEDFSKQLRQRATPCAAWHRVDLHNHSPASHDFRGNKATALEDFTKSIRDRALSVVMFTDHEVLPDTDFVEQLAKKTGALILPGLELNVFVDAFGTPAEKIGKNVCFHLLIGFDPDGAQSPSYWRDHLYRTCRVEERIFGGTKINGIVDGIGKVVETLQDSGAVIIPAHLHSGADAFRSRSIDVIYGDREFLKWCRTYFTALDVRSDKTASFFDGKHAETGNLEIGCIQSSDAHSADDLGISPSWVQMEHVSFTELKAGLELPGRLSRREPPVPTSYVKGIHVEGQFLRDLWMSFSPHLNVLIGVKGSGKTSLLECLRFGLGTEVPAERVEEVNRHLSAILGPTGRVRLLIKRDDGAELVLERRITDRSYRITFDDDREVVVDTPETVRFAAAILGWHEIEHAATDRQIRRLHMDAIAGRDEIKRLTEEARLTALSILRMHEQAATKYSEYVQLSETVKQYEAMRDGLQQLKDANLIELRDQMASALADKHELSRLAEHVQQLPEAVLEKAMGVLQTSQFAFQELSPLKILTSQAGQSLAKLTELATKFSSDALSYITSLAPALRQLVDRATQDFAEFSKQYSDRLSEFSPEVQRLIESHRDVLEKTKDLPNLRSRLNQLHTSIEVDLNELSNASEKVAAILDGRLDLRIAKIENFNKVLSDAGVMLTVVPGIAKEDEYTPTLSQFTQARETYGALRSTHGGSSRFHRMLSQSYASLREDLLSGDRVLFSRADFGRLITIFENDDLDIRFAVGKPGEMYSPIDQLSAGQRCTAVFPILLKLRDGPLVIDQPEDNLDNRHIAQKVAVVLAVDKQSRQILMTSHNANLVVLSDPECIATFEVEGGQGVIACAGFLSHRNSEITASVLDILDGGELALALRSKKYGKGSVPRGTGW